GHLQPDGRVRGHRIRRPGRPRRAHRRRTSDDGLRGPLDLHGTARVRDHAAHRAGARAAIHQRRAGAGCRPGLPGRSGGLCAVRCDRLRRGRGHRRPQRRHGSPLRLPAGRSGALWRHPGWTPARNGHAPGPPVRMTSTRSVPRATCAAVLLVLLSGCLPYSCRREESTALMPADSASRQIAFETPADTLRLLWIAGEGMEYPRTVRFSDDSAAFVLYVSDVEREALLTLDARGSIESVIEDVPVPYLAGVRGDTIAAF